MKKIIFMGTPEISTFPLNALIENKVKLFIVTQPDKPNGRNKKIKTSPVKDIALKHKIKLFQPQNARDPEFILEIKKIKPDLIITCAYGQIISKELLDIPKYGCVNLHASLLPELRGASPINSAVIRGFKITGLTLMYMNSKMDEGNIIKQYSFQIKEIDNAGDVYYKMADLCKECIQNDLNYLLSGKVKSIEQDHNLATYCSKLNKDDELINWDQNGEIVFNKIRGMNPFPGCYSNFGKERIKIKDVTLSSEKIPSKKIVIKNKRLFIGTKTVAIEILTLQKSGKKTISAIDFINGINKNQSLDIN